MIIIIQLLNNNEPPDDINLVCQDCTKEVEGVLIFFLVLLRTMAADLYFICLNEF